MRYLAIDPGGKRTGLAVGDDVTRFATPVGVIETAAPHVRLQQLDRYVEDIAPDALVIGLPLNMDGTEGPAAKQMREFGEALAERYGLPVHFADERLTSEAANERMAQSGLTHQQKKSRRDALAAAAILNPFLENLP